MNLREFELHRPLLGKQLRSILEGEDFAGNWEYGWDITPRYDDGIRFVATHPVIDTLVCVGPDHPGSMTEPGTPGCVGTWWWEEDLLALAARVTA